MGANCGKHLCKGKHDCGSCALSNQAKWVTFKRDGRNMVFCSKCYGHFAYDFKDYNYCPDCGAKMEQDHE